MSSAPSPTSAPSPPGGSTNTTSPPVATTPPTTLPVPSNTTSPPSTPPAIPSASPPAPGSLPPPSSTTPPPSTTPSVPSAPSPPTGDGSTPAVPSTRSPPSGGGGSSSGGSTPSTPAVRSPPSRSSPSAPSTPTSSGTSSSPSNSSGVSTSLVVGVAVGGAVLLILITILCVCCRRRKRSNRPPPGYYGGPPPPRKEEYYGGQAQGWQQQNTPLPPSDHVVKIPPPHMSPPPPHASRPPLAPSPPPPPQQFSSSGGVSSSNYSGPDGILPPPPPPPPMGFSKNMFTYEELSIATDAFSDANLLGQGGFGYVHRGMLMSGEEVAVKQLKAGSGQGEREFQAEVEIISRVHHKHLVSLVGYCMTGSKRMLVYEFVPNNTLEFHLHGKGRPTMAWPTRLKIAIGSARGLAYLHEDCQPKIIHRDIKTANILLDFKFEAKVADFGLAKFSSDNNTHVSTRVMGTFGYMAPEYASSGKLTEKSDVFSYGVMLLELITGKRPVDSSLAYMDDSLVDWARPLLTRAIEDQSYEALADPRLQGNYDPHEMSRMVACAAACVRHSARRRPRMSQIVRALEGDVSLDDLNDGVRPGHSSVYGSVGSSDYDSGMYREDMKRFRQIALSSQEYASTEHSEPTSEYGQNPSGSSGENPSREVRRTTAAKTPNDSRGF